MQGFRRAHQGAAIAQVSADQNSWVAADPYELLPSRDVDTAEIPDSAESLAHDPNAQLALENGCASVAFDT